VSDVVEPKNLMTATVRLVEQVCIAPRGVLLRTKAKALRRAGVDPSRPTLDL